MKYFLVLLAVTAVFAHFDPSIEVKQQDDKTPVDNQQEVHDSIEDLETLTNEHDDGSNQQSVIPSTQQLCSINVTALTALINDLINKNLASQPVVQMLYLSLPSYSRVLSIQKINGGNYTLGPILNTITIGNGQTPTTSTILAYRPKYDGFDHTGLGAVFLNLERLFPCAGKDGLVPVCRRFTEEEDGFFGGRTITEAGDIGNNMKIFGTNIKTYGFVFEGCPILNGGDTCLPTYFETVVTCLLPRSCL